MSRWPGNHERDSRAIFLYNSHMQSLDNLISEIQNSQKTLFILCGFPYAGKSYVAKVVKAQTDAVLVSIDDIFYAKGFDWDSNTLPDMNVWEQIFNESYEMTEQALLIGKNVLYDSTNQTVASRDNLRKVARSVGADTKVVYVKSPVETVWKRWEENQKNPTRSVVNSELVEKTIQMFEEPTSEEDVLIINN
jgi:predicted kinase